MLKGNIPIYTKRNRADWGPWTVTA